MRRYLLMLAVALLFADLTAAQQVIPVAGAEDLRLRNLSPFDPVMVTLRFEGDSQLPTTAEPLRLQPGEELIIGDVISSRFGSGPEPTGQIVVFGPEIVGVQWRAAAIGDVAEPWKPGIAVVAPSVAITASDSSSRRRPVRVPEVATLVRVGDITAFNGSHGVSGTAMIMAKNVIRLSNFRHDGSAPGLDMRIGLSTTTRRDFAVLRVIARQTFNGETIDLTLPDSVDLNSFDTFTVWCYEFNTIIAEGRFRRP